ncbi:saccharopine dehydrogenase NADP-binding domain-containing protein [Nocardioides sp.]|uniref:saccharopine dehydrogenase family protein n=1 Tax=Nocardioides sp. TaxID=35761 RepID=UPI00199CB8D8|nr:saccharopine dehydrogenase NADP-binding domain-containing protein [Nocardioides sp.]MBC7277927.1 saccharopine dehydrogenase NADP-binding domain-containing protein [Nocardioides sp.]
MTNPRDLDIVLFGATGFTGGLVAEYLAEHAPQDLRWALAGRSLSRLEAVRDSLGSADVELIQADVNDSSSLVALAARARVVITTVGPYLEFGEPLVKACAEAGTDYVDLTGEPEFVDRMFVNYDAVARANGARIVHACGFDSIPHDLGAFYTVRELAAGGEITDPLTMKGVVRSNATFSGGTFHSALGQMSRPRQMAAASRERRALEERPVGRRSRAAKPSLGRDSELGYWLLPLPTIDPFIVARSGAALEAYGPAFTYSHFAGTKTLRFAVGGAVGAGGLALAMQVPPLRAKLGERVKQGTGPSEGRREKSWFTVDFVAESGDRKIHTKVAGGDPGYTETAKMLAESALCLAFDTLPETSGSVTTAVAMGDALLARLQAAGIRFEVVDAS